MSASLRVKQYQISCEATEIGANMMAVKRFMQVSDQPYSLHDVYAPLA